MLPSEEASLVTSKQKEHPHMSLIVSPIPVAGVAFNATLYSAKQVRYVESNTGIIHFVDGSSQQFSTNSGATGGSTFVPSSNVGNVVPNPGDFLLVPRLPADPAPPVPGGDVQPGQESLAQQFQVPGIPVAVFGAYAYYTLAQFNAQFKADYTAGLTSQGIVP